MKSSLKSHLVWLVALTAFLGNPSNSQADFGNPPIVDAGPPMREATADAVTGLASVLLDGSGTVGFDGPITYEWSWVKLAEPFAQPEIAPGKVVTLDFPVGEWFVTLKATDENGTNYDYVNLKVLPAGPKMLVAPQDLVVAVEDPTMNAKIAAWLASNGGAVATSPLGEVIWTNESFTTQFFGVLEVVFTATDLEGASTSVSAFLTKTDSTLPTIAWKVNGVAVDPTVPVLIGVNQTVDVSIEVSDLGGIAYSYFNTTLTGSVQLATSGNEAQISRGRIGDEVVLEAVVSDIIGNLALQSMVFQVVPGGQARGQGRGNGKGKGRP